MQHISDNIQFSVLMPVYNQASFIRRAIASLMMQTYSGFELIIINDGSTDCTEQFITDYLEDKRVAYIKMKPTKDWDRHSIGGSMQPNTLT